ncbi:MAG: c-type cytochrome [Algiphilus sp.]
MAVLHADGSIDAGGAGYCTTCHGAERHRTSGAPGLCGAEAGWIAERLRAYRDDGNTVMTRLGHGLTSADIEALSRDAARLYADNGPFCRALRDD